MADRGVKIALRVMNQEAAQTQADGEGSGRSNLMTDVASYQVTRDNVTFALDTKTCALLKYPIKGTGRVVDSDISLRNKNGTYNYTETIQQDGTATDDHGGKYIFTCLATTLVESGVTLPEPRPPFVFEGPDRFELVAITPGAPSYVVHIYFHGRVNADGSFTDLGTAANTDPNCDPI